jgi:dihydrolipoamide dehydrogenase
VCCYRIVSSTGALELKQIPEQLVVVGGGVIGLEMGSVWSRLGSKVTVLEYTPTIVPSLDADIRRVFERVLKKQGIAIQTSQKVTGADTSGPKIKLSYEAVKDGAKSELEADIVLVATGRRPVTGMTLHSSCRPLG